MGKGGVVSALGPLGVAAVGAEIHSGSSDNAGETGAADDREETTPADAIHHICP
jgi:hypothetical protein